MMTFEAILPELKAGKRAVRTGWEGKQIASSPIGDRRAPSEGLVRPVGSGHYHVHPMPLQDRLEPQRHVQGKFMLFV